MCVYGHFLYYSSSSKFIPKVRHLWRFCRTTALTKWPFLPQWLFKVMSFSKILNVFLAVFPRKHLLCVLRVNFCKILIAFAKWATLPLHQIRLFFIIIIKCICKPFSHRTSLFIFACFQNLVISRIFGLFWRLVCIKNIKCFCSS